MILCGCCFGPGASRRGFLKGLGAAAFACTAGGLGGSAAEAASGLIGEGELAPAVRRLAERANAGGLQRIVPFRLGGRDLPWTIDLGGVGKGQQVTFLLAGRWYLAREHDLWVEPGVVFHARVDRGTLYNPMTNTGTLVAEADGRLFVARSAGEWASPAGNLATPVDFYVKADGWVEGVALVWSGDALTGLSRLLASGDVNGLVAREVARLGNPALLPPGWRPMFLFGNGEGTFRAGGEGEIRASTHKTVGILQHAVSHPLEPGTRLDWSWFIDELPAPVGEAEVGTHDYLSIAVEFDDGQDLTYFWSAGLPAGQVFRCPLPLWQARETHMVVRSGRGELGRWVADSRPIHDDYRTHVGGNARTIVGVWLIANSVFLRRSGAARFRDIVVAGSHWRRKVL